MLLHLAVKALLAFFEQTDRLNVLCMIEQVSSYSMKNFIGYFLLVLLDK